MSPVGPPRPGNPTPYSRLTDHHDCEIPNAEKVIIGTVMEDGQMTLVICQTLPGHTPADPRYRFLEYITIGRADYNLWLGLMRRHWEEEKRHPLVPQPRQE